MPGGVDGGSWELELDPDPDPKRSCLDPDQDPKLTSVEGPSRPPGSPSSDFNPLAPGSKVPGLYCPPPSLNYKLQEDSGFYPLRSLPCPACQALPLLSLMSTAAWASSSKVISSVLPFRAAWCRAEKLQWVMDTCGQVPDTPPALGVPDPHTRLMPPWAEHSPIRVLEIDIDLLGGAQELCGGRGRGGDTVKEAHLGPSPL